MATRRQIRTVRRGEIYLVRFDPTEGAEIGKTRPALIIQNNVGNRHSPITIVAALTSQYGPQLYPTEVLITPPEGGLKTPSVVLLNQLRSVAKQRFERRLGQLSPATMLQVDNALVISLGLVSS